ncbi:unnamed protein product [Spirodela intermedia]|uniref:protein-serine/threonine phosphatase n=1 Tax=Spirodela intermedia TaxID=51605 RepID=A0A7I8JHV4_SPIIN|nr:unnamed protein product [Spirodela intermedia]CAA6669133.1 unnamed protein product [Spirodela intermedia]
MRSSPRELLPASERTPRVPLATLIGRELRRSSENAGEPRVRYGQAGLAKRGEDYFLIKRRCQRALGGSFSSTFSVFAVFDGHNGAAAAVFTREHLLDHVLRAIPQGLTREEWLRALPQALVAGFVKTDIEFQSKGETSGTTVTLAVVDGLTVTVASVGDSRCILDSQGGVVSELTGAGYCMRGEVGRLNICGRREVGPLRCWPGGLCLSRSIGDSDVGEFIVPIPHVKQVRLPASGGRLIIASDGIWDALSSEAAAKSCRGLSAELAAKLVVKEALRTTGLKDDTTCLVVDIALYNHVALPPTPQDSPSNLRSLIFWRRPRGSKNMLSEKPSSAGAVEELFEESSARLAERLKASSCFPADVNSGPCQCAVCQADLERAEDLLPAAAGQREVGLCLCPVCQKKKDAMEGKTPKKPIGGAGTGDDDDDHDDDEDPAISAVREELRHLYEAEGE